MDPLIRGERPLGFPWDTVDPFLFCAYHDDTYPPGDERLAPTVSLKGRNLGSDFVLKDGFRMYHGHVVPGFPQHPHRGFETVTLARHGYIDHADSLGAQARFGKGDVQWITAGRGIVHSEMFPLLDSVHENRAELFQIWLNLPAADKLVDPHFTMLWSEELPRLRSTDAAGRATEVTVVAGALADLRPPAPPPRSWAARPDTDCAIWTLRLAPGATFTLPPATDARTRRTLYFFRGPSLSVGERRFDAHAGIEVRADVEARLGAGDGECEILLLQGRPIAETVAQYGPFVMNTSEEIQRAFLDYRRTQFGGWPWPKDDPDHGRARGRFARYADGRVEER